MIRRSPIRKRRSKPRPGRLQGAALEALRAACFERDHFLCTVCNMHVSPYLPHTADASAHMAHVKAKRIGLDVISNVRTECGKCHRTYHCYGPSRTKPCPPKIRNYIPDSPMTPTTRLAGSEHSRTDGEPNARKAPGGPGPANAEAVAKDDDLTRQEAERLGSQVCSSDREAA